MAEWKEFGLGFAEAAEPISDTLGSGIGTLVSLVEVAVSTLEVLSSFLVPAANPISGIFQQLLAEIQTLLDDLSETGVYGLFIVPTSFEELAQHKGGYGKFEQKFLKSIHDVEDPERPQIAESGFMGGVFLLITQPNPSDFIKSFLRLYRYFDRQFEVRYPAPVGVRIRHADEFGIPIDDAFWLWDDDQADAETLYLEWQEPRVANDIFLDFMAHNKFYIERSKSREGKLLLQSSTPSTKKTPLDKKREEDGREKKLYDAALDEFDDPIFYWEPIDPDDPFVEVSDTLDIEHNRVNFLSGSYAYVIDDVARGSENGYYYRVRSVPNDTKLVNKTVKVQDSQGNVVSEEVYELQLDDSPIGSYAEPCPPVFGSLPNVDSDFDLPTALLNVYRAAYLLRFDLEYRDNLGETVSGPNLLEQSLSNPLYGRLTDTELYGYDVAYWIGSLFENENSVLTYTESKQELKKDLFTDPASFDPFGGADEFIFPRLDRPDSELLRVAIDRIADNQIKKLVPSITANESFYRTFQQLYQSAEGDILSMLVDGISLADIVEATGRRQKVYTLLQLIGGSRAGAPPNWESLRLLEDLFPFVNEISEKLFNTITSFNNLLQDTLAELKGSLDSATDRLAVLTTILDAIDDLLVVLDELAALNIGANVLWLPPSEGGTSNFVSEFLNAENPPDNTPDDFVGGIVLAFGGASQSDVEAFEDIFNLIFGV